MEQVKQMLSARISSGSTDVRLVEVACFSASIAIFVLGILGVARLAATPGEILIGSLVTCIGAVQLVVAGVVIPSAMRKHAS